LAQVPAFLHAASVELLELHAAPTLPVVQVPATLQFAAVVQVPVGDEPALQVPSLSHCAAVVQATPVPSPCVQ
jgi:hypothetical protein